jgi:hypothetical protein
MAIERLKFRCYRCNQLLASSANKAGTVVSCPKCQADLLVPALEAQQPGSEPELLVRALGEPQIKTEATAAPKVQAESPARGEQPVSKTATVEPPRRPEPVPSFVNDVSVVIPPDLADLRPEDLRVEAEFFQSLTRKPPPPITDPVPWPPPEPVSPSFELETAIFSPPPAVVSESPGLAASFEPAPAPPVTMDYVHRPLEAPSPPPEVRADVPPIEIEPPSILPSSHVLGRVREVVLPASVVLTWSLFVLVGITLSFVAGLLMGHFIWKTP